MTVAEVLILYTRPGCHLCDQAVSMLDNRGLAWREVNVDDDPLLQEKYSLHVPVLYSKAAKKELFFPFGEEQLSRFEVEISRIGD